MHSREADMSVLGEEIKMNEVVTDEIAKKFGIDFRQGINEINLEEESITLERMASDEANSRIDAENKKLQTSVSPNNRRHVSFDNPDSSIAKKYESMVQEEIVRQKNI